MSEFLRRHIGRRRAVVAGALALGSTGAAVGIYEATSSNAGYCYPQKESVLYPGDPNADPGDQSTWHQGVEAETEVPAGARELGAGFTDPGDNWHDTPWLSPNLGDDIGFSIGADKVKFRIQARVPEDSASCGEPLNVTFSRKPYSQIAKEGDVTFPAWP